MAMFKGRKGSSKFGLYALGWGIFLAGFYAADAVFAANKLGELSMPIALDAWATYGVFGAFFVAEWVITFLGWMAENK